MSVAYIFIFLMVTFEQVFVMLISSSSSKRPGGVGPAGRIPSRVSVEMIQHKHARPHPHSHSHTHRVAHLGPCPRRSTGLWRSGPSPRATLHLVPALDKQEWWSTGTSAPVAILAFDQIPVSWWGFWPLLFGAPCHMIKCTCPVGH